MNNLNMSLTYSETALLLRLLKGIAESNTLREFKEADISLSVFASLLEKIRQLDDDFVKNCVPL